MRSGWEGRYHTRKGTRRKIHLPLKILYLESVRERTEMLGVLYPFASEQKVHTKELKEDRREKSMKKLQVSCEPRDQQRVIIVLVSVTIAVCCLSWRLSYGKPKVTTVFIGLVTVSLFSYWNYNECFSWFSYHANNYKATLHMPKGYNLHRAFFQFQVWLRPG